jgi:hypothetical protein
MLAAVEADPRLGHGHSGGLPLLSDIAVSPAVAEAHENTIVAAGVARAIDCN